jgi:hypothetical protein
LNGEKCAIEYFIHILPIPLREKAERFGDPFRGPNQPFSTWVFSHVCQQLFNQRLDGIRFDPDCIRLLAHDFCS